MKFHYSIQHANKVLAILRKEVKGVKSVNSDRVIIEAWANGREQGYCIKCYPIVFPGGVANDYAICIAHTRNGDSILIVHGPLNRFDLKNQPDEALWASNRHYFGVDSEAAKFIAKEILKVMEPLHAAIAE